MDLKKNPFILREKEEEKRKPMVVRSRSRSKSTKKDKPKFAPRPNQHYNFQHSASIMLGKLAQTMGFATSSLRDEARFAVYADTLKLAKTKEPDLYRAYQSMLGEMVYTIFGTKMPEVEFISYAGTLVNQGADVISSVGSLVNNIFSIIANDLSGFGLWAAIFDEYMPAGPCEFMYFPRIIGASGYPTSNTPASNGTAWAIGLIDYADLTTALSTIPEAVCADTHKIFPLNPYGNDPQHGCTKWKGHILGAPDESWLDTTVLSTGFVALKMIQADNVYGVGNVYWGYLSKKITLKFRQMNPV